MPDEPNQTGLPSVSEGDGELRAMNVIVAALRPLREEERKRVLEYVLGRFGAVALQAPLASVGSPVSSSVSIASAGAETAGRSIHDIRSLKEAKNPRSANEMAALVAYYVSELAQGADRKPEIDKSDIERYFKSAHFKLTAKAGQTLINARHAGYLDPGSEDGRYKLNPVGYNLIAHRLGNEGRPKKRRRIRAEKRTPRRRKG